MWEFMFLFWPEHMFGVLCGCGAAVHKQLFGVAADAATDADAVGW